MNTAPVELLYALVFGAILLVQYLMKRFGGQRKPADALQEVPAPGEQAPEREAPVPSNLRRVPEIPAVSLAATGRVTRFEAPSVSAAIPRQRSVSRSLLGDGQDLRRTIVAMTLLGPCRGQEPPDNR